MPHEKVTVSGSIPEPIAKAILAAIDEMPSLRKGDRNQYGNYAYVSIDDYLAEVPKCAAKHGLFWQSRELNYEIVGEKGAHIAFTYAFDLGYKDGTLLPEYGRLTVIHPVQGAQTSGSALAYAEKLFQRFLFKIVTGEQDADATDSSAAISAPARPRPSLQAVEGGKRPASPAKVVGGIADGGVKVTEENGTPVVAAPTDPEMWKKAADVFVQFAPECKTGKELREFWNINSGTLEKMETSAPDEYSRVKEVFSTHKAKLSKKGNTP